MGMYIFWNTHTHTLPKLRKENETKTWLRLLNGKTLMQLKNTQLSLCYACYIPHVHNPLWKLLMLYQLSPNTTCHICFNSKITKFDAIARHSKRQQAKSEIRVRKELISEFKSNILNRKQYLQPVKQSLWLKTVNHPVLDILQKYVHSDKLLP